MKPNVEMKRQRTSKVALHLKEKREKLLTQLKNAGIIRETSDDDEMGSPFVNPIILRRKNDYVKLVTDARYLNSVRDFSKLSRPMEPGQMIMTKVNCKFFSVSDLCCAYRWFPLSPQTQSWPNLSMVENFTRTFVDFIVYVDFQTSSADFWRYIFNLLSKGNKQSTTLTKQKCSRKTKRRCSQSSMNTIPFFGKLVSKPSPTNRTSFSLKKLSFLVILCLQKESNLSQNEFH